MYQRADISKTKLIFQCTEGSKQVLLNVSAIWTIPQSIRFQIDFLPLLQLFKYGKKINPNCFRWVIHHFNNNFFVSRLLQLSEECVLKTSLVHSSCLMSIIQAFQKLLQNRNNQHQHISPHPCSFSLPCVTWLPAADFHTLNIRAVATWCFQVSLTKCFQNHPWRCTVTHFPFQTRFKSLQVDSLTVLTRTESNSYLEEQKPI